MKTHRTRHRATLVNMAPKLCLDGRNRQDRVIARRRLGRLRDTLVTQRTLTRYLKAVGLFHYWCQSSYGREAVSNEELDQFASLYLDVLWEEGEPRLLAGDTLSGLQHVLMAKRILPSAWRLFGAWAKNELPARAPPMPLLVCLAIAGYANSKGRTDYGTMILLGFHCFLRTIELFSAVAQNLWLDAQGTGSILLPITKSGQRIGAPESVTIDDPSVGKRLLVLKSRLQPGAPLIQGSMHEFRVFFNEALEALSLQALGFRPYSLRRGGATHDWLTFADLPRTVMRGRWANLKTAKIYINDGWQQIVNMQLQEAPLRKFAQLA